MEQSPSYVNPIDRSRNAEIERQEERNIITKFTNKIMFLYF